MYTRQQRTYRQVTSILTFLRKSGYARSQGILGGHMQPKVHIPFLSFVFILILVSLACSTAQPAPVGTPQPITTLTRTAIPTNTPRPSPTLRPTQTPNLTATQHLQDLNAEIQKYFDLGYLTTTDGRFIEYPDFKTEWARLTTYNWGTFNDQARDFYMSAHFRWSSEI